MSKIVVSNLSGSEQTASILPIDRVMFEREFGKSVSSLAREEREEYFLWLSWHALKREGVTAASFDDWLATVADYSPEGEDTAPPLDQAASLTQ